MRLLPFFILMAACDDEMRFNTGGHGGGDTVPEGAEGWCAVQAIFEARCVSCHGAAALGGLDLSGDAHAAIVDQPSASYAGWTLVVPEDPQASLLYRKVASTHEAGTGTEMPPGSGLDAESLALIEAWILEGAPSTCDDTGGGGNGGGGTGARYHPDDFALPENHSVEAKRQDQACVDCHGADLKGSADGTIPSCDTCHTPHDPEAWRTDCTFCHGGQDNTTGAPPVQLFGATSFQPHTVHVEATDKKAALDCWACHTKPDDVLSVGHVFLGDGTPAQAEVDFSGGISPETRWDGMTCANNYCHGNGRGDNGSIEHTAEARVCGDCHSMNGNSLSEPHDKHLEEGARCTTCHGDTAAYSSGNYTIADRTLHVNGQPDVAITASGISYDASSRTCTGSCHLDGDTENHNRRSWRDD